MSQLGNVVVVGRKIIRCSKRDSREAVPIATAVLKCDLGKYAVDRPSWLRSADCDRLNSLPTAPILILQGSIRAAAR